MSHLIRISIAGLLLVAFSVSAEPAERGQSLESPDSAAVPRWVISYAQVFPYTESTAEPVPSEPVRLVSEKSCTELYLEITDLLDRKHAAEAGFWDDQKNRLAGAAGAVFKPALFYLGYSAIRHFQEKEQTFDSRARIAQLRAASADKQCFVQ